MEELYDANNNKNSVVLRFDKINNLPENIEKIKLNYCVTDRKGKVYETGQTKVYDVKSIEDLKEL